MAFTIYLSCMISISAMLVHPGLPGEPTLKLNLTSFAEMSTEHFAKKVTGSDNLDDVQKKQIREQQEVSQFIKHTAGFIDIEDMCQFFHR